MAIEIERKFLVANEAWRDHAGPGRKICQGYLARERNSVRVRRTGDRATLTIKGPRSGLTRLEHEYNIPLDEADQLLARLCMRPLIEKTRFEVVVADHVWEIDIYDGVHRGLVVAEVELGAEDEAFVRPIWLGAEVTGDPRYGYDGLKKLCVQQDLVGESERSFASTT